MGRPITEAEFDEAYAESLDYFDDEDDEVDEEEGGIPDMEESFDERAAVAIAQAAKPQSRDVPALLGLRWVPISSIRIDAGTQSRVKLDVLVAVEYQTKFEGHLAEGPETESSHARAWGDFPPLEAFFDEEYWLVDGYHRLSGMRGALERAGLNTAWIGKWLVPVRVFLGTRREAILYAAGVNANHGLRRTSADKRRAVEMLLRDDEWRGWSDAEIARRCAVDPKTVATVRKALEVTLEIPESVVRKAADGRTVNTEKIGARPEPIQYAPIWQLENAVAAFFDNDLVGRGDDPLDNKLSVLQYMRSEPANHGEFWKLRKRLPEHYRKSDLIQAINNVRGQRRQAKLQASAKVTYMEPRVVVLADEPTGDEPSLDELEAVALVAAEQAEEDAERAARDVERVPFERAMIEVEATVTEIVTVTMPREIAEHLQRAAAAFKVGDMRLVDQAWLEVALSEALVKKDVSK